MLSSTTVTNINNKKPATSILEWFLKDHVIPKTVVMMLKIQLCPHRNKLHFKIYNRKKIEIGCKIRDFFRPQILVHMCTCGYSDKILVWTKGKLTFSEKKTQNAIPDSLGPTTDNPHDWTHLTLEGLFSRVLKRVHFKRHAAFEGFPTRFTSERHVLSVSCNKITDKMYILTITSSCLRMLS